MTIIRDRPPINQRHGADKVQWRGESRYALESLFKGELDVVGEFTILGGTTTTRVADERMTSDKSIIILSPTNSVAAGMSPVPFVTVVAPRVSWDNTSGYFDLSHPNPGSSATFKYCFIG